MRRSTLLIALPALLAAAARPAAAQGRIAIDADPRGPLSTLQVRVVDEKGAPMQGVYVTVPGAERGASTDAHGRARLERIPRGNRLIEIRRTGYIFRRIAAGFSGDTVRRDIAMTPAPVEVEGVTATSWGRSMRLVRAGFYQRQQRGLGSFMTRQELDEIRPLRIEDAFRYMRGFMVRPERGGDVVVSTRSPGCSPLVYVDGGSMFGRGSADQAQTLDMVPVRDVEAIEAYQGAGSIPEQYVRPGMAQCGVILVWTRH